MTIISRFPEDEVRNVSQAFTSYYPAGGEVQSVFEYKDIFGKSAYLVISENAVALYKRGKLQKPNKVLLVSTFKSVRTIKNSIEIEYGVGNTRQKLALGVDPQDFSAALEELLKKVAVGLEESLKKVAVDDGLRQETINRRGALIGVIKPETGLQKFERAGSDASSRKLSDLFDGGGNAIEVYENVVIHLGVEHTLDQFTSCEVTMNGQVQVTHRPTLTRMGLLAPLPGTALIAGFALGKKTTHDSREVLVTIASTSWTCSTRVSHSNLAKVKAIANRLNKICESLGVDSQREIKPSGESKIERLTELNKLLESGLISKKEADLLKNEIMES
jgi:hypothetical protein